MASWPENRLRRRPRSDRLAPATRKVPAGVHQQEVDSGSRQEETRLLCPPSRRTITIHPAAQYLALKQRREQEKTRDCATISNQRAGIVGTISQGFRTRGLHRSR